MELEQEDGNSIAIKFGSPTFIGRELGLRFVQSSYDRSISRRHVSLQFLDTSGEKVDTNDHAEDLLLSFEVVGKNPILVCSKGGEGKNIYRRSEKGVLKAGDRISLSINSPNFFFVKRREGREGDVENSVLDALARRERRTQQRKKEAEERAKLEEVGGENEELVLGNSVLEIGEFDISEIDPVKEFGFLVRGHEFDHYCRLKNRPFKDWNWFLEDLLGAKNNADEEDEAFGTSLKGEHQKRKKRVNDNDEDWTGENEDLSTLTAKPRSTKCPTYSTRSKDPKKPRANIQISNKPAMKAFNCQPEKLISEDDETLGGFIVDDDDIEEVKEVLEEETEEEEEEGDDEESDVG